MTGLLACRVMVVEDSFMLAMEVKSALEKDGAQVIGPFATSENAVTSLQQGDPDCALLDVNLGAGASFDLARTLRMRGVPFLFFTGYDRDAFPAEFDNVDRLEKPVNTPLLLKAVEACCRWRRTDAGPAL